ncbi:MAG: archaellin/type IV pilin N-terminal domain-containing protein [Candidatus Aenigmatarchaeota archaeon]
MRGISTVIATILMLMITIALAGTAYLYISGAFTQQLQGIEAVDQFCAGGTQARITLRNLGTNALTYVNGSCTGTGNTRSCGSISVTRTDGGMPSLSGDKPTIEPGTTATLIDNSCTSSGTPRTCVYRIVPPAGRSVQATVNCPG